MSTTFPQLVTCPVCLQSLELDHGGWAYRYTQVLIHLDGCSPNLPNHERSVIARDLVPPSS